MNENLKPHNPENAEQKTEILTNEYGAVKDSTVVVEEPDRTVLLTEEETIVIEKPPVVSVVPKNRPRKVYAGMWGTTEIVTVGVALLAVLTTVLLFVLMVLPAKRELEQNRANRDQIEAELKSARDKYGSITSTEARVVELVESVEKFEDSYLPNAALGKTALYQRLNSLITGYGLINTTGPDYEPLEVNEKQAVQITGGETGKSKYQSLFPGVYVSVTVEGPYQNLRRFLREIETSRQFVIISAVELEPTQNREKPREEQATVNNPQTGNPGSGIPDQYLAPGIPQQQTVTPKQPRGKMHGEVVSLRLEMAAYFRRPNFGVDQ